MPHGVSNVPREDAEEAMRLIRRMSEAWNINTSDVGIMGFSAGGHLASTIATHSKGDAAPNFQILFYPVITMEAGVTHQGSRENLLGKKPKRKLLNEYCNEQHVTAATPRAFIVLAHNDKSVSPLNSIGYYEELCHHKVPTSLHIYPEGGHGFGILESFPKFLRPVRHTFSDFYRNRLHVGRFFCNGQSHHTSPGVDGFLLVKDEIADAVVDGLSPIRLNGL